MNSTDTPMFTTQNLVAPGSSTTIVTAFGYIGDVLNGLLVHAGIASVIARLTPSWDAWVPPHGYHSTMYGRAQPTAYSLQRGNSLKTQRHLVVPTRVPWGIPHLLTGRLLTVLITVITSLGTWGLNALLLKSLISFTRGRPHRIDLGQGSCYAVYQKLGTSSSTLRITRPLSTR